MPVTATELKNRLSETLERAQREPVSIIKNGRPYAVLVSQQEYERLTHRPTARELLAMPREVRAPYLQASAAAMEAEYRGDLAKPIAERELTAFTALDCEPFLDPDYAATRGGPAARP